MSQLSPSVSLPQLAYKGIPVVTTETLAQAYEVDAVSIRKNFSCNKERFSEGKHYFSITGLELRTFRLSVTESNSQISPKVRTLTLWTERGAARHAKMLNSDKAWDMFELLEETFFRVAKTESVENLDKLPFLSPSARAELKGIVDAKLSTYPASVQGKARAEIWTRFNRHFRIAEYAQLPASRMAEARDYLIELEVKALKVLTSASPALTDFPADMAAGRKDALRKIRSIMNSLEAARAVVSLFCYPAQRTMDMPRARRLSYDAQHDFYAAALDCLSAAHAALEAGYMLERSNTRG